MLHQCNAKQTEAVQCLVQTNELLIGLLDSNGSVAAERAIESKAFALIPHLINDAVLQRERFAALTRDSLLLHSLLATSEYHDVALRIVRACGVANALDAQGNTALHLAIRFDARTCVEAMLHTRDDDLIRTNDQGETPVQLGMKFGAASSVAIALRTRKIERSAIAESINQIRNADGNALIHCAAAWTNEEDLRTIVEFGGDVNLPNQELDEYADGGTPLHMAAIHNRPEIIAALVSFNANLNSIEHPTKSTPLHLAADSGK